MSRIDAVDASIATGTACDGPRALVLAAREVPLGGVRGMSVRRTLPQRDLPMVGAWCFLDRFGPQRTTMRVEPHPHIGLQTVTWPLVGRVRHRDALGSDVEISRGALNLMTSGEGISHSEYSVGDEPIELDALQLWVALPEETRHGASGFEQHVDLPALALDAPDGTPAGTAVVVLGELGGVRSPATAHTPIIGAELQLPPGVTARVPFEHGWEHALVTVLGTASAAADVDGGWVPLATEDLVYLGTHRTHIDVTAGADGATLFLLGGEPFRDELVMWWNFVARTHEEIVQAREDWEAGTERFGVVAGHGDVRIPAPALPTVRLTPRRRRL